MYPIDSESPITYSDGTCVTFGDYGLRIYEKGSEMVFGDYGIGDLFHIEKTELYKKLNGKGFKTVEFVLLRPNMKQVWFVEARKTMPAKSNKTRLDEDIVEISQKFVDSFMLACGIWFGQHVSKVEMHGNGDRFFKYGNRVIFALMLKNRKGKLTAIAEYIKQKFPKAVRMLWEFDVVVLNEEMAIDENIIVAENELLT